jgi:hypothetical protein
MVILIRMSTTRYLQIAISDHERFHFQAAARRAGLPLAEWARLHLREKADEMMDTAALDPYGALALLKSLDAPIAPVETLIEESVAGRY